MIVRKILCLFSLHNWVMGMHVTGNGKPQSLYRECVCCHKYQVTSKPKKYHPVKYEWIDRKLEI